MKKITEQPSNHRHLEKMSVQELLNKMNQEDQSVPLAVQQAIPQIEKLVTAIVANMKEGGRVFYIGAGTSGRLGILDASEIPPTYGAAAANYFVGLIAGGDGAIRKSIEHAEDDLNQAWLDLKIHRINSKDTIIGIAASGTTPYVIGGLKKCQTENITTACITCNLGTPVAQYADFPVEVVVGPEFVTGSTRMKSGTAQKLVLNMISTSVMIQLGHVKDNKMVDMQLSNDKLRDRGAKMIANELGISYEQAFELMMKHGSVRAAIEEF